MKLQSVAILLLTLVSAPQSHARDSLTGPIEAAAIAFSDFAEKLTKEREAFEKIHSCDSTCRVVYNIQNYNVGISSDGDHFVVVLLVRKKQSIRIIGGGGEYWIRKNDGEITRYRGYE